MKTTESNPSNIVVQSNNNGKSFAIVTLFSLCILFLSFHFANEKNQSIDQNIQLSPQFNSKSLKLKAVERIEWAPHLSFAYELVDMREPVILTNTVVTTWKALQRWSNRTYLSEHPDLQKMDDVKIGSYNTFVFTDKKTPLAKAAELLPKLETNINYRSENLTASQFFSRIQDPSNKDYMYWYGRVGSILKEDVEPNEFIWKNQQDFNNFGLFMWLSNDDVRPPIHYDMDHNFYVHLSGRKRWVLFPPWEWSKLSPFPRLHPSWHKSQCKFDDPDPTICPHFFEAEAREAILEPGEVMYIPPYWWHHVQSVTGSVSLASWSDSGVTRAMRTLWKRKLFFEEMENEKEKTSAMNAYINELFQSQYGARTKEMKDKMKQSRWRPLTDMFSHIESFRSVDECGPDFNPSPSQKKQMEEDLDHAKIKLDDCQGVEWSTKLKDIGAIRDQELMDYAETIASEVVGAENFFNWMNTCFLRD